MHHGDGVQAAFYDDPRVLTISLHETPALLFPGTGRPSETGGAGGDGLGGERRAARRAPATPAGCAPSTPSSRRCCGRSGRRSWSASTAATPTGWTRWPTSQLTIDGQRAAHAAIHQLAHETAGGRWLLTGGGGYELVQVVPRTWTHLLAEAAGQPGRPAGADPGRLARLRPARAPAGTRRS